MTVDHFYPLYIGGTNDYRNLIPLCYDCNQNKAITIYNIEDYCKYLMKLSKKELCGYYEEMESSLETVSMESLFKEDTFNVNVIVLIINGKTKKEMFIPKNIKLERVWYKDLQEVYDFIYNYCAYFGFSQKDLNELEDFVSETFDYGCSYLYRKNEKIQFVISTNINQGKGKNDQGEEYQASLVLQYFIQEDIKIGKDFSKFSSDSLSLDLYKGILKRFLETFTNQYNEEPIVFPVFFDFVEGDERPANIIKHLGITDSSKMDMEEWETGAKNRSIYVGFAPNDKMLIKENDKDFKQGEYKYYLEYIHKGMAILRSLLSQSRNYRRFLSWETARLKEQKEKEQQIKRSRKGY